MLNTKLEINFEISIGISIKYVAIPRSYSIVGNHRIYPILNFQCSIICNRNHGFRNQGCGCIERFIQGKLLNAARLWKLETPAHTDALFMG